MATSVRYLFVTTLPHESDFYGRVGAGLRRHGHEVAYVTVSRQSAGALRAQGFDAVLLQDAACALPPADVATEVDRLERRHSLPTFRDAYRADPACAGRPEGWCARRAVDHFRVLERVLDEVAPDVLVPEVGCETVRVASHLAALERGIPVLFLFYTIFPRPLRLYVDTMHAPIVHPDELRPLDPGEEAELEEFTRAFKERAEPIRSHRSVSLAPRRLASWAGFVARDLRDERDNAYHRPFAWLGAEASGLARASAARLLYRRRDPGRPFVYFPLHVTDDYKIKRLIPHCMDQAPIVEQIADSLPAGHDLVLKEHPMSVGRNPLALLRRLASRPNVRLVHPHESSHELIEAAEAVAVISSTVGLEALLYDKPVLTVGQPFYGGYGVTLDVDSFAELREAVPALLRFRPDPVRTRRLLHAMMRHCYPGAPVQVDASDENARELADTLDQVARELVASRLATGTRATGAVPAAR